jgi:hypothetical protein
LDPNVHPPSLIKWFAMMIFLALACLGSLVIVSDQICSANIAEWIPYYPEATLVSEEHDFIRLRAMGTSKVVLSTPDDAETTRQFYRDTTLRLMRAGETRGWATTDWRVDPNPDGQGSLITLVSECGK